MKMIVKFGDKSGVRTQSINIDQVVATEVAITENMCSLKIFLSGSQIHNVVYYDKNGNPTQTTGNIFEMYSRETAIGRINAFVELFENC